MLSDTFTAYAHIEHDLPNSRCLHRTQRVFRFGASTPKPSTTSINLVASTGSLRDTPYYRGRLTPTVWRNPLGSMSLVRWVGFRWYAPPGFMTPRPTFLDSASSLNYGAQPSEATTVSPSNIGIVTPHRQPCYNVGHFTSRKTSLNAGSLKYPNIGSPEQDVHSLPKIKPLKIYYHTLAQIQYQCRR